MDRSIGTEVTDHGSYLPQLAWILLALSSLSWFSGIIPTAVTVNAVAASGGSSSEYAHVKILFTILAIAIVLVIGAPGLPINRCTFLIFSYAAISLVGAALIKLQVVAAAEDTLRLILAVITGVWIVRRVTLRRLMLTTSWLASLMCLSAMAAYKLGLSETEKGLNPGRLFGYFPPLQPNDLGAIAAIGVLTIVDLWFRQRRIGPGWSFALASLLVALGWTESRTAALALLAGLIVLAIFYRERKSLIFLSLIPLVVVVLATVHIGSASLLDTVETRGQTSQATSTLDTRFNQASSAIAAQTTTGEKLFGQGLPERYLLVPGPYNEIQPVDAGWYAAYLEGGLVGVLCLFGAALLSLRSAWKQRSILGIALWLLLFIISLTTNFFNNISLGLLLLAAISVQPYVPSRRPQTRPIPLAGIEHLHPGFQK